jgi:hypothetical protein
MAVPEMSRGMGTHTFAVHSSPLRVTGITCRVVLQWHDYEFPPSCGNHKELYAYLYLCKL